MKLNRNDYTVEAAAGGEVFRFFWKNREENQDVLPE